MKGQQRALGVVVLDPPETRRASKSSWYSAERLAVEVVQVVNQVRCNAFVVAIAEQVPVEAAVEWFHSSHLRELANPMNISFIARVSEHESEVRPQIGELPASGRSGILDSSERVAGGPPRRARAAARSSRCRRRPCRRSTRWWWCLRWIGSRAMYSSVSFIPAHVPLVVEAQPARIGRPGHRGKRGRFFGQRDRLRAFGPDDLVHCASGTQWPRGSRAHRARC